MMTKTSSIPLAIEEYINFLNKSEKRADRVLTKTRVDANFENYGKAIDIFLAYPDVFVDLLSPRDSDFSLFFVQRIVLRMMARYRQSYSVFPRAFSKSFLAFLSRYIYTMLIPGHYSFVVSGTKKQAAQIAKEKVVMDLWNKFPLLANEMQSVRVGGKLRTPYVSGIDYAEFRFTHGGQLDVVGSGSSTRGGRRHSGIFEEVIELDPTEINEVILPLMNKQRTTKLGQVNPNEPHSSKIFVTTAGFMGTYAYEKLIETICYAVIDPDRYAVLGGTYILPLMHGILDPDQLREVITSPTFSEDSLDREYKSIWSGTPVGAAFTTTEVSDLRKIVRAELKARKREKGSEDFYVLSADMAKDGTANTVVTILKVRPGEFAFSYQLVNLEQINTTDYEKVSARIKKLLMLYEAELFVYDANGIGAALRDWLNKEQYDTETSSILPAYGIINPPDKSRRDIKPVARSRTICYEVKAVGDVAGNINKVFFSKMGSKSIRFLVKKEVALQKFSETKKFSTATNRQQKSMLLPYLLTDKLEEEMRNLDIKDVSDRVNPNSLLVVRRNRKIEKDYYSSLSYGIFGVHTHIEVPYYSKKRRKKSNIADYIMKH